MFKVCRKQHQNNQMPQSLGAWASPTAVLVNRAREAAVSALRASPGLA